MSLGPRDRAALGVLALRSGSPVRADTIAEALWGDEQPASAAKVVQGCVVRLRKVLGAAAIQTVDGGYRLQLHADDLDVVRFEGLVAQARRLLADSQPDRAGYLAERALSLWRGEPFAELADWEAARIRADHLTELHREAEELRVEASLALGHHDDVVTDLVSLVQEQPTRERRWALLALAQYRCGRQADALATLRRARHHLVTTLGLDPGAELGELEQAVLRQDPALAPPRVGTPSVDVCPYPGLFHFDAEDVSAFFGRDADVAACLRRVDETGVVAVVGPSGCGKSSVLRAGVAAALLGEGYAVTVVTPGPRPLAELDSLRPGRRSVLVVDQCEEVFAAPADEAREFMARLVEHVRGGGVLALALRADRVGELSAHAEMARLVEHGLHLLGPLTAEGLREAIEGPAAQTGLRLEEGLVELLVQDVVGEPGALPLLSHVLRRTWELREGRTLTVAAYRATGGVREAVAQSAEALFRGLEPAEQALLRDLMTRLVSPGDQGMPVRQRLPRRAVDRDERRHELVERLVTARLLSADGDTVEIAHESLAVAWPRLRSWLDDDVDGLRVMRHLSVAAESWDSLGRPTSELYRGVRQARAAEWAARARPALTELEREFLDASEGLAAQEQRATQEQVRRERRLNRRLRTGLVAVALLLVVAVTAGGLAVSGFRQAEADARAADARRLGAEALRAKDVDTALLLAVAGVELDDSTDTRANLLAALDETPALVRSARVPRTTNIAVDSRSGLVLVQAPFSGLLVRDPDTLAPVAEHPDLRGPAVVAGVTGGAAASTTMPELVGPPPAGRPAVVLVDETGGPAAEQLGGIPPSRFAQQDLTLSPNGRWLAVTLRHDNDPDVVGVWDLRAPERPVALLDLGPHVTFPTVTDDGLTLLSTGEGALRVTDLPSGAQRRLLAGPDLEVRELGDRPALSPDGRTVAIAAVGEVVLVDIGTMRARAHLVEVPGVRDLVFSASGTRLAAAGPEVVVWDLTNAEPVEVLRQQDAGGEVALSRDGQTLYSAEFDGTVMSWDLSGRRGFLRSEAAPSAPVPDYPRVSPDGTQVLYVSPLPEPVFSVRDVTSGRVSVRVVVDQDFTSWIDGAWSPDGELVTMTTGDDVVEVWEAAGGRRLARHALPEGEGASISFFTRDGTRLLVGTTQGRLHVLDARTLRPRAEPLRVAPADTESDALPVAGMEPGPGGLVLAGLRAGTFLVDHEARTVERLDLGIDVFGAGWSPDGERLFVTTEEGSVGLLDARTREWISAPSAAQPFAGGIVVFSPDGTQVATHASGRVGRWDGLTGAFLGAVTVGDAGSVGFTADGRAVRVAEASGRVRTWDLDPAAWTEAACRMAGRPLEPQEWRAHLPDRAFQPVCADAGG